ncbi:DNA-binding transcriptional activator of the SARP family [Nocardiopsis flavescens]|uniref:DNA-binding transcriptional activator of the SARP family n=1 Tax=Nocardiopsis flavescens TaxID=758803 RepID=A0A1M6N5E5_9ACTN|nr:DNA-binding transcriptional activator of the SARP family [Nocardiopsis flavescens]
METDTTRVRYRLLGSVDAHHGNVRVGLGGSKRRTVLAALLLRQNTSVPDDLLVDLLWGEDPPANARSRLQGHVHELRKRLGAGTIVRCGHGYRAAVPDGATDVRAFAALRRRARAEHDRGEPDAVVRTLRTALALWTGPALNGVEPALADRARPELEEARLGALEELHDAELRCGRFGAVLPELRTLCAAHPTRERFTGLLMSALHGTGRTGEALEAYEALRTLLRERMGIEPGECLRRLHLELLTTDRAPVPADSGRPAPRPAVRPAELPHGLRELVGREREVRTLDGLLDRSPDALLLITGVSGVGKTALALHWAHTVRDRFPDGQLYMDLGGSERPVDPREALRQMLRSLGVDPRRPPAGATDPAKLFRSITADLRLLFVFDDAACAEQVTPLLPGGRGSAVVVTSRSGLVPMVALRGARRLALDVLSEESSLELLLRVAGPRALASVSGPDLADGCGRLPLALCLTAARLGAGGRTAEAGTPGTR